MDETARRRQKKRQKTLPEETQKQLLRYPQKKREIPWEPCPNFEEKV
jgi:hypothetical protein